MRLRLCPLLVVLALTFAFPRAASADQLGFFRWWDSLSGPGPWYGFTYELQLASWAVERSSATRDKDPQILAFDPTGLESYPNRLYIHFGAELGALWTGDSDLDYAAGVDPPNASAIPLLATADAGKYGVEGGLGLGFLRLSGVNASSWHFIIEPRATFKPFVFFNRNKESKEWHEVLAARFYLTYVGDIDPADFGAVGPPDAGDEWVPGISLSVNLLAIKRATQGR